MIAGDHPDRASVISEEKIPVMAPLAAETPYPGVTFRRRFQAHIAIARLDHSTKNIFILPGIVIPLSLDPAILTGRLTYLVAKLVTGLTAATLIASSNYVINEVLDAPFDRLHPSKKNRPAARGLVSVTAAYVQWVCLMLAGIGLALLVSRAFAVICAMLWCMGCLYNIPPVRTKDVVFVDVLTESINNPLRMLLGWYMVTTVVPPASLLISYWMIGCYFMALKRFSEFRQLGNVALAGAYRRSFLKYTERSLLVSVTFYAAAAMLFFGAFAMRYRFELIFSFPAVALVMAIYFNLAFEIDGAVQNPEKLYRERSLMIGLAACVALMIVLLNLRLPSVVSFFGPKLP